MVSERRHVLLYGDVDLHFTDGSAVWLVSMAEALSMTDSKVSLLLKSEGGVDGLFRDLSGIENLELIDDFGSKVARGGRYTPAAAAARLSELAENLGSEIVIARGFEVCRELADLPDVAGKLWAYMTNIPQSSSNVTPEFAESLNLIAQRSRRIFAQTELARGFMEYHAPASRGKTILLPPMLPDSVREIHRSLSEVPASAKDSPLRIVYAGKFAKAWKTLEMCALPEQLSRTGDSAELTMIGNKVQNDPQDTGWSERMSSALRESSGVTWLGNMARGEVLGQLHRYDLGLAWRAEELDASHEISTKLLEYLACGVPPVVNRTAAHTELFGPDYPLFIDNGDVVSTIKHALEDSVNLHELGVKCRRLADKFYISRRALELERNFSQASINSIPHLRNLPVCVMASGAAEILLRETFGSFQGVNILPRVRDDNTDATHRKAVYVVDQDHLDLVPTWVDDVWVYYSGRRAERRRTATGGYYSGAFVADRKLVREAAWWTGVPVECVFVLPPAFDATAARPKSTAASYSVGVMVGPQDASLVSSAFNLLSEVRILDRRFSMRFVMLNDIEADWAAIERAALYDAFTGGQARSNVAGSWSLQSATSGVDWYRGVSWIAIGTSYELERALSLNASCSNTRIIRELAATSPAEITRVAEMLVLASSEMDSRTPAAGITNDSPGSEEGSYDLASALSFMSAQLR